MTTTNIRMRTLAERALRLLGVYQVTVPSLVALSPVLVPSALAYIKAYDDHQNFQAHHREHMGEGRAKVKALYTLMRHWTSVLTAIIPGFSEDSLHGTLSIPDQVLADAQRLIPLVEAHQDKLPDNSTLLAELNTMLTAATEEWNEAQRMLAEHAALIANVGTTKAALYLPFMSLQIGRAHV